MTTRHRFIGSLNGWFILNVIVAILIALIMNLTFLRFSGTWANPPIQDIDQLVVAASIAKTFNHLSPSQRKSIEDKVSGNGINVSWFSDRNALPIPRMEKNDDTDSWPDIRRILGYPGSEILTVDPKDEGWEISSPPPEKRFYAIAIRLEDHSWVMFDTPSKLWGLSSTSRALVTGFFILVSTVVISWFFGLRVARPLRSFANAVERFGVGARTQPLAVRGPIEIRETLSAFNAMQVQIQRLLDGRIEMFSAISHDLRAPLTRLKLRSELVDDERQRDKIMADIDELQSMVQSCLSYFQLESQPEEMTRFELGELLHTVIDNFRDTGKEVRFRPGHRVVYDGQPLALTRALTNLIDNAVKYGGHAEVNLKVSPRDVVITVQDQGPGVPPESLPRLFDPFYRVEPSRNPHTGGYGLGLAASRSIVHFHGGELTLANRQPQGLIATLRLPLHRASRAKA
ncbi:MAG: HAMP domain-containing histidine kinase [Salinicola sp.]|uniref:sensor histidine kinase n=1 Tax=Salinicola sp. TaxID=1978524 RepID=UPI001DF3F8DE|nr:HAMP domain-containing sensor histidine kinase [Salinicola sp.]NRB56818.1 HAMP domain-containing histidine kinase [Salinicola sp.]